MDSEIKKKQDKQEFDRIIDRMIRHYQFTIKIEQSTGVSQRLLNEHRENIKFLEDLRDGKIELNK